MQVSRRVLASTSLVVVHLSLVVVALLVYLNIQQRTISKGWSESNSFLLSRLVVTRQEQNFVAAKQLATTLAEIPVVKNHDVESCNELFARILRENPVYANLGVADTKGNNWCSAVPMESPIDVSDRPHFQEALSKKTFTLGKYTIGRIVHKPVVHVAYPVLEDDRVIGVVLIVIDLDWLNKMVANTNLPDGSRVGIYDNSGILLAHYPTKEEWLGVNVNTTYLQRVSQENLYPAVFATFSSTDLNNTNHVYTVSRFPDNAGKGIYFYVGIPKEFFASASDREFRNNLIPLGVFVLIFIVSALVDMELLIRSGTFAGASKDSKRVLASEKQKFS